MSSDIEPPKVTVGDHAHATVRGALGAIPFAGGMAVELFNAVVTPPIERRRDKWRESIGNRINELASAGFLKPENLPDNEVFISAVVQATNVAMRNHNEEKLEALRNAVMNAALPNPPDESMQQMFLELVDQFTVWHLRLLKLFQNPALWFKANNKRPPEFAISSDLRRLVLSAFSELQGQQSLCDRIAADLQSHGLCSGSLNVMMSAQGAFENRTSELGDSFLKFIEKPSTK